ncbi:Npun_F0813 family protein [Trichothermofontia sp.]
MFILKRQDVEITSIQPPKQDRQIPILKYQGQVFRLVKVFPANQAEEAKELWRKFTDEQGKACVLLEEPDRYSIWGRVRLEQLTEEAGAEDEATPITQACLLLLQAVYADIEDLLGARQAGAFQKELGEVLKQWRFPQAETPNAVIALLTTIDPLVPEQVPPWQEHHQSKLLEELHRIGKSYFGNESFRERAVDTLQDLSNADRTQFIQWLSPPLAKLWAIS